MKRNHVLFTIIMIVIFSILAGLTASTAQAHFLLHNLRLP
jgi:hypothetical protein